MQAAGAQVPVRQSQVEYGVAHILIVEDSPVVRMLLQMHLETAAHTVMSASDGNEALQLAAAMRPDLVISDVDMPNLDGYGLLDALRADKNLATIPVIFLTMHDDIETFRRSTLSGAADFVNKPINRDVLLNAIDHCLARRQPRQ